MRIELAKGRLFCRKMLPTPRTLCWSGSKSRKPKHEEQSTRQPRSRRRTL